MSVENWPPFCPNGCCCWFLAGFQVSCCCIAVELIWANKTYNYGDPFLFSASCHIWLLCVNGFSACCWYCSIYPVGRPYWFASGQELKIVDKLLSKNINNFILWKSQHMCKSYNIICSIIIKTVGLRAWPLIRVKLIYYQNELKDRRSHLKFPTRKTE